MLYIFDMGGVVTNTSNENERLCQILNCSLEDYKSWLDGGPGEENIMTLASNGCISSKEFWKIFSDRSGIKVQRDWLHFLFHPKLIPGTVQIIDKLKKMGHRVVCGTNTIDGYYQNHLERGDYGFFDQTYASNFMGVSKPDEDFWKLILEAENFNPQDTVFIDDKIENVKAAASLGIRAIHFQSVEQLSSELGI